MGLDVTPEDVRVRFNSHPVDEAKRLLIDEVRSDIRAAAMAVALTLPAGREKSLAITHLEEASFWATAGIARDGVE